MKKLLFIVVCALLLNCVVWLASGVLDFLGGVNFLIEGLIFVLLLALWLAVRKGEQLRERWGFGPVSPTELFVAAFFYCLSLGVRAGDRTLDFLVQDTFFIVRTVHFQFALALFFGLLAGVYYLFPRITGRPLRQRLGNIHFGLSVLGLILLTQQAYFYSTSRRVIHHPNFFESAHPGVTVIACLSLVLLAQGLFVFNLVYSATRKKKFP